ncbi:MAG: excinuclease ABC subunit UvrC [Patescibacteria group bacterium]
MPSNPGIYLFLNEKSEVLYVGKAKNLKKRVSSYFAKKNNLGEKTQLLISKIKKIKAIKTHSELEALLLEADFIKKHQPQYNSRLTDGKAYPLIRVTISDRYPKVLIARKASESKSIYFGPYPSAGSMKIVLKILRKIFPFQSVINHPRKICLYNHLGLCPCPPVFDSPYLKKEYKKNIKHLTQFLNGKTEKVIKDLEEERNQESTEEHFEKASQAQKKIDSIRIVTSPVYKLFDEEINPNLKQDVLDGQGGELTNTLNLNGYKIPNLKRIECYDISNISGKFAVGSMIVFTNGEASKSLYRKFKIRYAKEEPNDFAMMEEVLRRRFKHPEWPFPDLLVVDGGKGQVSVALKVLNQKNLEIPLIGLAKREETIVTSDLKEINLSKDSPALLLIMRIRDEAHRFAITYHRNLRSKGFTGS